MLSNLIYIQLTFFSGFNLLLIFENLMQGLEDYISILVKVGNTEFFTKTIDMTLTTS